MKIRPVQPEDMPQLVELCALHAEYENVEYSRTNKQESLMTALFSDSPSLFCWVIAEGSTLLGYTSATKEYSTWDAYHFIHMDCLYLTKETRGHGMGYGLIKQLKVFAKQQGCPLIQWQTPPDNELGIQFYHRIGASFKNKRRYYLAVE